jgi:hypothetical protein
MKEKQETLALNKKKLHQWGNGLGLLVSKEAKIFGWDHKTHVIVSAIRDENGDTIIVRKAKE